MKEHIPDYFEGVLQIRDGNPDLIKWIHARVKSDGRAKFTKEKKVPNGVDLYITDQHYLQNLGRQIKQRFSGIMKVSKRLHTVHKMTSKELYRVTVLFKTLPFKRGDIVTLHGEQVEILTIGERAHIKDVKSGKKRHVDLDTLSRVR